MHGESIKFWCKCGHSKLDHRNTQKNNVPTYTECLGPNCICEKYDEK